MNADVLIQNIFNLFIISIVLDVSIMAIFSTTALRNVGQKKPVEMARDAIIIILALFLCYKVKILTIFTGTGVKVNHILDTIIAALVMTRMTNFVNDFFAKIRLSD